MSVMTISQINQSRSGNTVTLTFTCGNDLWGIRHVHWTQYASNGTSVLAQGEAVMVFNPNGGTTGTNFNAANMSCTITIPNATSGLYAILDFYTIIGQRTSKRVQFT